MYNVFNHDVILFISGQQLGISRLVNLDRDRESATPSGQHTPSSSSSGAGGGSGGGGSSILSRGKTVATISGSDRTGESDSEKEAGGGSICILSLSNFLICL